jgi:hypothetical protein
MPAAYQPSPRQHGKLSAGDKLLVDSFRPSSLGEKVCDTNRRGCFQKGNRATVSDLVGERMIVRGFENGTRRGQIGSPEESIFV